MKKVALAFASGCLALLAAECAMEWLDLPAQPLRPEKVRDEILVYRMPPGQKDADRDGFRNSKALERADIVALGDSHTWGFNVRSDETWPSRLGVLTRSVVYNLGGGGYGPLQYFSLLPRALSLRPRHVIVGLYLANDLWDVCRAWDATSYWKQQASRGSLDLGFCAAASHERSAGRAGEDRDPVAGGASDRFIERTRLGLLVHNSLSRLREMRGQYPPGAVVVQNGRNRTFVGIKRLRSHRRATDLDREDIARSLAVTEEVLVRMAKGAEEAGARLVVLFVPSKESVFFELLVKEGGGLPDDLLAVVANERRLKGVLADFLDAAGISRVDAEPYVRRAVQQLDGVYPNRDDGHPLAPGYQAYADAVYDKLRGQ